ncbi:16S rRNA (uracil(1498)-N(3))-methyltransferase [Glycomyces algeriensis]|uniref:Ribosomal RNA small subunit methyltransferase E n=1 Tax=Glycomyces algeriensis TaxID=256037 RepID=A0A9W6GDT3_9ACTN|nr:16S rRNA (uracil(1498)-N(3))-methyltransferase [Glycomyces algeriensis]MDA1369058.1 16S rRNA (uracil(1498)-N(3))-methyltransferase [Glycomyces algeriensis]MDR7352446.1 16S rRNA (uracil1498-N3)-methyltransferase [Glycomyces algeriensis]GLI45186.1 ribosomal RNA small subunit methyltransferase E [Glycomyces algeriensis]
MSAPVFLVDAVPADDDYTLDGPEGHHAADVQRLQPGETLLLSDGASGMATARVTHAERGSVRVQIVDRRTVPAPDPKLTVVQALPKGDRGERAVQMLTEIGVDEVIPWAASRSIVQWKGPRGDKARAKWTATAREASKQARRARFAHVAELHTTKQLVARLRDASQVLVLHEEADLPLSQVALPESGEIAVVIGPEGSISPDELAALKEFGEPIRLGDTVLRTSTAGPAALAVLQARLGRW